MPDPFQFGDIPKPDKFIEFKLRQLGISDPGELVRKYAPQAPEPNKVVQLEQPKKQQKRISAEICRLI